MPVTDGHRLLVMGPTVTVAAAPTAGEYIALPWTMERLLEALGADVPVTVAREALVLPSGLRVLLAEDDTINRNLIAEMLRGMGASVRTVNDGAAAVEEVARDRYDVVLMDLNMPVMDGLEAVKVIRERVAAAQSDSDVSLDTGTLTSLGEDLGDPGLVRDAVGVYLEELPGRLVEIHRCFGDGSREGVRAAAHALKGASAMLGAQRLSALCAQMETESTDALLADLTTEAEVVEMQMRDYLIGTAAVT